MTYVQGICLDQFNTLVSVGWVPQHVDPMTVGILGVDAQMWRDACFREHHARLFTGDGGINEHHGAHTVGMKRYR